MSGDTWVQPRGLLVKLDVVNKLQTLPALAVVVGDERVVEEADKLLVELVVGAVVGGELNPRTEEVCDTVLTAAAAYVAGISQSPSSKNRSVGPFVPSHVAMGQFS